MGRKSDKVTAYINRQQPFAKPILRKIRAMFHRACPQVEERMRWGFASFDYKGILGVMAGFKQHVRWGLWKSGQMNNPRGETDEDGDPTIAGRKPTSLAELPSDKEMLARIKRAVDLNERGVKPPKKSVRKKPPPKIPSDLAAALKKNARASTAFKAFSPSHQREYIEWITKAKRPETRDRRISQAIEWMSKGKPRNWKYMNC